MDYSISLRATNKDEAKAALVAKTLEFSAHCAPHEPDWTAPLAAASVLIDAMNEDVNLDVMITFIGYVNFLGDKTNHLRFSFSALLTDRLDGN